MGENIPWTLKPRITWDHCFDIFAIKKGAKSADIRRKCSRIWYTIHKPRIVKNADNKGQPIFPPKKIVSKFWSFFCDVLSLSIILDWSIIWIIHHSHICLTVPSLKFDFIILNFYQTSSFAENGVLLRKMTNIFF